MREAVLRSNAVMEVPSSRGANAPCARTSPWPAETMGVSWFECLGPRVLRDAECT